VPIRDFTSQLQGGAPTGRTVDDAAPEGLRQQFVDLVYQVHRSIPQRLRRYGEPVQHAQQYHPLFDEANLHKVITQSLGFSAAGQPYGGFRYAIGRDIGKADWPRVYDLMSRLWDEIPAELRESYRSGVNRILAAYSIAWDMGEAGCLHRVTPPAVQQQIEEAFRELSDPRFTAALQSFHDAMAAYDDRPQRGRDVCKNIMDALEAVAKEVFGMLTATFGNVLAEARKGQAMAPETISVLQKMYDLANTHFRHGMTTPFVLQKSEVDFVLVSCLGGILLFVRL
jgi:hypothetical protein